MTVVRLPRAVFDAIRAQGERTFPHECCGALLGLPAAEGWHIESAMPAANTSREPTRNHFEIAPAELVKIAREARRRGVEIAGFYHSHPDHPARWSASDLAHAHWLGCCYLITEVAAGHALVTNAFLLRGAREEEKHFESLQILIDEGADTSQ